MLSPRRRSGQLLVLTLSAGCIYAVYFFQTFNPTFSVHDRQHTPQERVENDTEKMKRILHGTITQNLDNGQLALSLNNKTYSLWKDDPPESPCVHYKTKFGFNLTQARLVSFPCSGNTWTRYLLEAASGIFTGSIYNDMDLYKAGFLAELGKTYNRETLVQKSHATSFSNMDNYKGRYSRITPDLPAVLLIRDPAKAIISYWKFKNTEGSHTSQLPETAFKTIDFHKYVVSAITHWEALILDRLLGSEAPVFVLYYEALLTNPIPTLRKLLDFLRVPANEGRLDCVTSHLTGQAKRQGNKDFDPYTAQEKVWLNAAAKKINMTVQLLGYQALPQYCYQS